LQARGGRAGLILTMDTESIYLTSLLKRMEMYQDLGSKTFAQLGDKDMGFQPDPNSNSISTIVRHMHGNMLSRFTNFLTEDGEKPWRDRDSEFEGKAASKAEVIHLWQEGWDVTLGVIRSLEGSDLGKTVTIRGESLTVLDALNRQLAHYAYHTGQIVYLGKVVRSDHWKSLSIPKRGVKHQNDE
jgi:hypothetical protein